MNYMLKSILEKDKEGRAKKQEAILYRDNIYKNIEAEKHAIQKEEMATAALEVAQIKENLKNNITLLLESQKQENQRKIQALRENEKECFEAWVQELYDSIINDQN